MVRCQYKSDQRHNWWHDADLMMLQLIEIIDDMYEDDMMMIWGWYGADIDDKDKRNWCYMWWDANTRVIYDITDDMMLILQKIDRGHRWYEDDIMILWG